MNTVLIVSYPADAHAEHLRNVANELGVDVVSWDASMYPHEGEVALEISPDSLVNTRAGIEIGGTFYDSEDIKGVWWRRPGGAKKEGEPTPMQRYMQIESEFIVRSLRDFFPSANWISDPEATRLSCRKPVQLQLAKEVGFTIPESCITNSPASIKLFVRRMEGRSIIMKPVGSAFMPLDPSGDLSSSENKVVFTRIVDPALIVDNIDMVRNCPVIFQEAIIKDFDLRVTVVDSDVFAAKIVLEGYDDKDNLDWRNHAGKRVYSPHTLPVEIQNACVNVVSKLGLRFGCVDLGFSYEKGYVFFEVNPQGQWLPSEQKLGYTISRSLLESLTK